MTTKVTAGVLANGAVHSDSISYTANTIPGNSIVSYSLIGSQLANLTITASQIASLTITGTQIANNTIDGTKIALGSDAQGDIMYYNGTDWARLAAGVSGQFLKTQGTGANPTWANDNTGMTLLSTLTTTSGTVANITGIDSSYRNLFIEVSGVSFTTAVPLQMSVTTNNGTNWGTAVTVSNTLPAVTDTITGHIDLKALQVTRNTATNGIVAQPALTANTLVFTTAVLLYPSTANGTINGVQFSGGTFDAGAIRIYGVK